MNVLPTEAAPSGVGLSLRRLEHRTGESVRMLVAGPLSGETLHFLLQCRNKDSKTISRTLFLKKS